MEVFLNGAQARTVFAYRMTIGLYIMGLRMGVQYLITPLYTLIEGIC